MGRSRVSLGLPFFINNLLNSGSQEFGFNDVRQRNIEFLISFSFEHIVELQQQIELTFNGIVSKSTAVWKLLKQQVSIFEQEIIIRF
jgi:hypothetical protein